MHTRIEPADLGLCQAAELIRSGQLVAFPTETVYGLGGDAGNAEAIERIYQAKGRPANNPLIVHVPDISGAHQYSTAFPVMADALAEKFWPGPLTMVVRRNDLICPAVCAGNHTVALRCPDHPVALALLRASGRPIAAPSANRSGYTSPTTAQHVFDELADRIALILDGGSCGVGLESTVVDMTGAVPTILRAGAITAAMLGQCLAAAGFSSEVGQASGHQAQPESAGELKSPGLLESHYAPRTSALRFYASEPERLYTYLRQQEGKRFGLLCMEGFAAPPMIAEKIVLPAEPAACGRKLYAAMRELDRRHCDVLLIQCPEATDGLWLAIHDRLRRATRELP